MAIARVHKEAPRPLNDTEQRWLLEQLLRRQTSEPAAAGAAATSKEASSMIVRPASTVTDPFAASATGSGSEPVDPGVVPIAPARFPERGAEPTAAPARPAEAGVELAEVPAAPPRLPDRPAAASSREPTRSPTRSAHRAAPVVEHAKYRAVFACCMQARDAPTEQSPS